MVQLNFDARQHTPLDNDPVPEGWYNLIIDESSAVPTKDGNPNHLRLVLRFSIMDGPHQNRKIFNGLNIRHTNIQTMEIANRELSAICAAVNLPFVQDTQQLHNIPLKGRVKIRKDPTGQYDDQAEIKSYKPISFVPPTTGFTQPGAPQQTAPSAPQGWATPQAAPQTAPNGNWQQPQQPQPWGQPQQQPAPQQTAPVQQPVQYAQPAQQPTPPAQPPQQPAPAGFAAPTPPPQAGQQPQQPANPQTTAAQAASPPWARGPA